MAAFGKHDRALPKRFSSSRSVKRWWHKGVSPAQQLVITVAAIALNVSHGKESIHTSLSLTPLRKAVSFAINFPKSSNSRPGQEKDVLQKGSKGPWITYILLWSFVECWHLKLKAWCPTSWRSITICKEQKSNTHSKSKSSKPLPKKKQPPMHHWEGPIPEGLLWYSMTINENPWSNTYYESYSRPHQILQTTSKKKQPPMHHWEGPIPEGLLWYSMTINENPWSNTYYESYSRPHQILQTTSKKKQPPMHHWEGPIPEGLLWYSMTINENPWSNTYYESYSRPHQILQTTSKKNSHPCTIGKGQSLKVFYGIPWPLMKIHDPIPTMKAILDPTKSSKPLPKKNSHPCTIGKGQSLKVFYGIPWPLMKTHDPIPTMKAILDPTQSSKPLPKKTATHAPLGRANPWRSFMVFHDH